MPTCILGNLYSGLDILTHPCFCIDMIGIRQNSVRSADLELTSFLGPGNRRISCPAAYILERGLDRAIAAAFFLHARLDHFGRQGHLPDLFSRDVAVQRFGANPSARGLGREPLRSAGICGGIFAGDFL